MQTLVYFLKEIKQILLRNKKPPRLLKRGGKNSQQLFNLSVNS
jgi:hypothetical protein